MALIFLLMFSEHIATAWEWVRSNSEAQAVMRSPDLTDLRERAEQGDASALATMGNAYNYGEGGMPRSTSIAMQYYAKAYEKAIEQGDLETERHSAGMLAGIYFGDGSVEEEKWMQRHTEAIKKIEELEKAERQKLIEEHEAMIPQ